MSRAATTCRPPPPSSTPAPGTRRCRSCYLLDSPLDELDSIYDRYHQVARLSKHAGGIGLSYSRIRTRGSLIRGTNGHSNGIVPFLKTLDASVAAVNQGGRRKGAAAVYLETWHADIEEFLELRDNTGEDARRTHNLNLAHWVPDEFMRRVEADAPWSLFSPADVPELVDLWGEEFDAAYRAAEAAGLARRTLPARELYGRMMRTLAQTGNGWMTFKDAANRTANQTAGPARRALLQPVHGDPGGHRRRRDGRVQPRLGQPGAPSSTGGGDDRLGAADATVRTAVTFLDRVVDINFYPTEQAGRVQLPLAAGGSGRDGPAGRLLQAAAALRLARGQARCPPGSPSASCSPRTRRPATSPSATARCPPGRRPVRPRGVLHPDHYGVDARLAGALGGAARADRRRRACATRCCWPSRPPRRSPRSRACTSASSRRCPTSSSARRCPASSSRSTPTWWPSSSELGVWDAQTREALREANGSVQGFGWIPAEVRELYRTAWEIPQRAPDRHGRRPHPVPRPEPVAEPVPGDADHRQALLDVRVRLEARA